ncbi:MAG: YARHG domain-containing protein [Clostridium sp.]|uniref:YARHG domain-containing protein n=1 Tax=Clostridium sp. TaxID=1506 RepID=UPI003EE423FA
MKFCKRCGNKLNDNVRFCAKCGLENEIKIVNEVKEEKEININEEAKLREEERVKEESKRRKESRAMVSLEKPKVKLQKERIQDSEEKPKKIENRKKKFKGKIIGVALILIIGVGGAIGYFLYDDILYKKYQKDIEATSSVSEKFIYYDKIAKLEKFDLIKDDVRKILKKDSTNIGYLKRIENLKDEEKNKIAVEVLKSSAIEKYDKGDYREAKKLLDEASKFGYDLKDSLYTNIIIKLDENDDNEHDEGIISETDNMLFPDSGLRYLNEDELRIYSKEELAIARSEIYARHGYIFKQEPFKSYFNEKDWYTENHSFKGSDAELNDCELQNIQLLLRLEKER